MNSTARKMESGSICGVDNKSSSQVNNLAEMNNIRTMLCNRRAFVKNSAKLKSEIHSHINDLIETLRERERQLFLEIDVYDVDCFLEMTNKYCVDSPSEEKTCPSINEDLKVPLSEFPEERLKFVGDPDILKTKIQQFGQIEEVKEVIFESCGCGEAIPVEKSPFFKLIRKLSKRNGTKKAHKESTGSVESFEVIDGLDFDEYRKYNQMLRDEDDPVVSDFDDSGLIGLSVQEIGYSSGPKPNYHQNMTPIASQDASSSSDSQHSTSIEGATDPVTQINKQLQGLLCSSPHAKSQEGKVHANEPFGMKLNEQLKQNPKSGVPSFKTPTPSAIIQETFNKYLDQSGTGKWLASTNNEQQSRPTYEMSQWLY